MNPIAVIDYGMGNLRSVEKGLAAAGFAAEITRDPARIEAAPAVVLPGVGAFGACVENLNRLGLDDCVRDVIAAGTPFLGICVGMQLLFEESEEFGPVPGLGIFPGRCVRFDPGATEALRVPHMGWNQLHHRHEAACLADVPEDAWVYFVHSFYVQCDDDDLVTTTTEYGSPFVSSVMRGNVFACQFHPEKSQAVGLRILGNFGRLACGGGGQGD